MSAPKWTPGRWEWMSSDDGEIYLATPDRGWLLVMDFMRKGMNGATPRFAHWDGIENGAERERKGGILYPGTLLPSGRVHPDAQLIAAAPDLAEACEAALLCISELPATQARAEVAQMLTAALAKAKVKS